MESVLSIFSILSIHRHLMNQSDNEKFKMPEKLGNHSSYLPIYEIYSIAKKEFKFHILYCTVDENFFTNK